MDKVSIVRGDSILAGGIPETLSIIDCLLEIDTAVYGELTARDNAARDYWLARWKHRADMNHVLFVNGKVAGNLHIVPLGDGIPQRILAGSLGDGEFADADIVPYGLGAGGLYVLSLVVAPQHQGHGYAKLMWNTAVRYWLSFGKAGGPLVTIWSKDGERFFMPLREAIVGCDGQGHPVWRLKPLWSEPR